MHIGQRLGQLDRQQVEFSWGPLTGVQDVLGFLEEFTGQAELGRLHVVREPGQVPRAITREIARLAVPPCPGKQS
ncbi:hypothetical protein [Streptomyces sp. NPDC059828]|uniref:hypothetical protein n=1 Tax=Streptomyces sp. NPDC059828 TaxID=3346965 RepID=UPI00364B0D62